MAPTDLETDPYAPARPLSADEQAALAGIEAGLQQGEREKRDPTQFTASLDPFIEPQKGGREAAEVAVAMQMQQQLQEEQIQATLAANAPAPMTVADLLPVEPELTGKTDADIEAQFEKDKAAGLVPKDVTVEDYLNPLRNIAVEETAKIEKFNVEGRSYVLIDNRDLYVAGGREGGQLVTDEEERNNVVKAARNPLRNVDIPDNASISQFTVGDTKYALVNGILYAPGERGGQQVPPEQAAQIFAARDAAAQGQQQGSQYQAPQSQASEASRAEAPHDLSQKRAANEPAPQVTTEPAPSQRPSNAPKAQPQQAKKSGGGIWGALMGMEHALDDMIDKATNSAKEMFSGRAEPAEPSAEDRQAAYARQKEERAYDLSQHRTTAAKGTETLVAQKVAGKENTFEVPAAAVTPARQQQSQNQGGGRGGR